MREKPYSGDLSPKESLEQLNIVEEERKGLDQRRHELKQVAEILELEVTSSPLEGLKQDVQGLREVWKELFGVWNQVEELG